MSIALIVSIVMTVVLLIEIVTGVAWAPGRSVIFRVLLEDDPDDHWLRRSDAPTAFWITMATEAAVVVGLWLHHFGWLKV